MPSGLGPLTSLFPATYQIVKSSRSLSMSSSISSTSTSSTYSRSADDMLDRLVTQEANTPIHLWSAGNIRFNSRDLTIPVLEAQDLIEAMKVDERFELLNLAYLDNEKEEYKITFRRSTVPTSPASGSGLSDSE